MIEDITTTEFEFSTITVQEDGEISERKTLRARQFTEILGNGVNLDLILIPGGSFLMGSATRSEGEDEKPQHRVTLPSFFMSKYLITQEQWHCCMKGSNSRFKGSRLPIETISWEEAAQFCKRLSAKTKRHYKLPSEAQWEYACRALTTSPFYFGATLTSALANYNGEFTYRAEPKGVYRHHTTDVGDFPPNAFGLYDMHGNLWEWCADLWHDSYDGAPLDERVWEKGGDKAFRVARGGSWHDTPHVCRSAIRLKCDIHGDEITGFRVVI